MGQDHHIQTKSDPQNLKEADNMYESFIIWSRNILIILTVVLAVMAVTLV